MVSIVQKQSSASLSPLGSQLYVYVCVWKMAMTVYLYYCYSKKNICGANNLFTYYLSSYIFYNFSIMEN